MKKYLFAAVLALGIASSISFSTSVAKAQGAGDGWTVGSYCIGTDTAFIRKFTDDVVRGGIEAYHAIMVDTASPCYDTRQHRNVRPVQIVLVEALWDFKMPGGEELTMWVIEDVNGNRGWTWITPEDYVATDPA